jgi:hypothetical protein
VREAKTNCAQKTRDETRRRILPASKTEIRHEQFYSCTRPHEGPRHTTKQADSLTQPHVEISISELVVGKIRVQRFQILDGWLRIHFTPGWQRQAGTGNTIHHCSPDPRPRTRTAKISADNHKRQQRLSGWMRKTIGQPA